jgi:hypothetical protein
VVLTGDLTEWGKKTEFDDVLRFAEGLAEYLKIPRRYFAIVPGNHDINRKHCEAYFYTCEADDQKPEPPFWPKWKCFEKFFADFYQKELGTNYTESEPWTLFEMPDLKLVIAGLNSTIAESHRDEDHYGYIGETQLRGFAEKLDTYRKKGWFRIATLHHNVRRGPVADDENLRDAEEFKRLLGDKVNLVLHGHTHDGKSDWLNEKVPILAAGSGAVKGEHRPEEAPNQYQIIQLWSNGYKRWARAYRPGHKIWVGDTGALDSGNDWQEEKQVEFQDVGAIFPARIWVKPQPDAPLGMQNHPRLETTYIERANQVAIELTEMRDGKPVIRYFVSYAHQDRKLKDELLKRLKARLAIAKEYYFDLWDDGEILAGERWHEQIQAGVAHCQFGLLLVSPDFLGSSYIKDHELPAFVASNLATSEPEKRAIPVALTRIPFDNSIDMKGLEQLQVFHDGTGKAFEERSTSKTRNDFASELFQQILKIVKRYSLPPFSRNSGHSPLDDGSGKPNALEFRTQKHLKSVKQSVRTIEEKRRQEDLQLFVGRVHEKEEFERILRGEKK